MPIPLPFCFSLFCLFLIPFPGFSCILIHPEWGMGSGATSSGRSLQQGVAQASLWELEISCQILGEL